LNPGRDFWRPDPRHVETIFTFPGVGARLIPDDDMIWVLYGTPDQRAVISRIDRARNTFEDNVVSVVFPGWVGRRAGVDIARAGVIWSSDYFQGKVTAYDPAASRVLLTLSVPKPLSIAVDDQSVWVVGRDSPAGSFLQRYDVKTGTMLLGVPIDPPGSCCPILAYDALWVAFGRYSLFGTLAESSVLKVDPGSGLVVGRIDANLRVDHLLAADTSIWAGSGRTLRRMNPRTMVIEATIPTAKATSLLADGDSIWLASLDDEVVQRTDLRTNRVAATYFVGRFPRDVVANKGTVWVTAGVTRKALVRLAP
jgi:DNA-binding beta-propeller fold protein YncE